MQNMGPKMWSAIMLNGRRHDVASNLSYRDRSFTLDFSCDTV